MMKKTLRSPCVGVCSTGVSDNVCRGCKRYAHEVINWNTYSPEQQRAVLARLHDLLITVLKNYLQPVDIDLIFDRFSALTPAMNSVESPYEALYHLLRTSASRIEAPGDYGFGVLAEKSHLSLVEIRSLVEQDYYALSEAHYHRYFGLEHAPVIAVVEENRP